MRILYVENDDDWQESIREDFSVAGYEVASAASYRQAIEIIESSPRFNLIISC
jgi:CheY-like chemotaxis protein